MVFKFRDEVVVPRGEWTLRDALARGLKLPDSLGPFAQLRVRPHFNGRAAMLLRALVRRASERDPRYPRTRNLNAYMRVDVDDEAQGEHLAGALREWQSVELAYRHPGPVALPAVTPGDDPFSQHQGYLDQAPLGIDARYAWTVPGGDGAGQTLVDLEWGWNLQHEDLVEHEAALLWGESLEGRPHGTSVLGIIAAADNRKLCIGITPQLASIGVVGQLQSQQSGPPDHVTGPALLEALSVMAPGDVLLLEAQSSLYGYYQVPLEIEPEVFDLVRAATALGILVVAAAGNGDVDLDQLRNPDGEALFDRALRDSGAVLVGSAASTVPHARYPGSCCFGSRIDCFAWGDSVVTLDTNYWGGDNTLYRMDFSKTSAAAAIVAGAALAVQGAHEASTGIRLEPAALRGLLADATPGFNTPSANPAQDRIGVMPDLRKIIQRGGAVR